MRSHLAEFGVTVELSKGLVAIEQNADYVHATVAVHKSGTPIMEQQETIVAKYLLGTDGAKGEGVSSLLSYTRFEVCC
jgi:FAD binding domain